jgi:hypothetical protein
MTGDFNGDGRTDLLCYGPQYMTKVGLGTSTGFAPPVPWLTTLAFNNMILGDFNANTGISRVRSSTPMGAWSYRSSVSQARSSKRAPRTTRWADSLG